jgi:hypothetical protein
MFLTELSPIIQELIRQPIAFTSGFCSGLLRLNLNEEPLAGWLSKQGYTNSGTDNNSDRQQPKSITIE